MSDHQREERLRAQHEALDAAASPGSEGPVQRSARGALARFLAGELYRRPEARHRREESGAAPARADSPPRPGTTRGAGRERKQQD